MHFLTVHINVSGFQRRRKVPFSNEEIILILRAYQANPSYWTEIINDIKANLEQLSPGHQRLYQGSSVKQLKDRVSNKSGRLLHTNPDTIEVPDISYGKNSVALMQIGEILWYTTGICSISLTVA